MESFITRCLYMTNSFWKRLIYITIYSHYDLCFDIANFVDILLEILQGPELVLKKNQLLTVLPYIGREYLVTLELYLNSYTTAPFASVVHFTAQGNRERYGDRNPGVWMGGHNNHTRLLHVSSSINGNVDHWIDTRKSLALKTWYKISISQTLVCNQVWLL